MARVMTIITPLGGDTLLFHSMTASEMLGRLFEYNISVLSEKNNIDPDKLLGKNVTVKLELQQGGFRFFDAYVTRFGLMGTHGRYYRYQIIGRPWLWLLTRTSDCRIFQAKKVPEVIKEIFNKYSSAVIEDNLTGTYEPWTYCVQYRETDFNFVSRLMEQEGIYYYFKHSEGKHTLVLADSYTAHSSFQNYAQIPYISQERAMRIEQEYINDWLFTREIQPGAYVIDDYDFERPSVELQQKKKLKRNYAEAEHEYFDYPGEYVSASEGEHYVQTRLEELQAQHELANGGTNARGMAVGYLFKLTGQPRDDQNREYLTISANYNFATDEYESTPGEGPSYSCSFTALHSKEPFRSSRITPKPVVQGPQTAIVVGPAGDEIYTDKHGRVKTQFHWDRYGKKDENSSCWIRVSHPWAGKNWGMVAIPRIGQEVIVDFLEGDPDQPIITGRVYNAEQMPPTALPNAGMVSGIKSNSTPGGGGYNEMTMDDTKGKEKITIHGQYDMATTVENDQTNTVNNKFTETIKSDATIKITEGKYSHDVVANTADYHVQGALNEKYDATQTTTVKDNIKIASTAGAISISSNTKDVHISAGTHIQLQVGASKIYMDSGGKISIEGVDVAIKGSAIVVIKGGIVHSEADSEHQTKGALVLSEGSATNTIKGGMVMLNP